MQPVNRKPAMEKTDMVPSNEGISSSSRRQFFLKATAIVGGGMLLGVGLFSEDANAAAMAVNKETSFAPGAFIRIAPDGQVTLIMPAVEMGQGTYTSVPMILAEELDVSLDNVKLEAAPRNQKLYGNPIYVIQVTGGSTTMHGWWMPLRKAGASARAMLVSAAASQWSVTPESCRTENGVVFHDATGRSIGYGALASRAAMVTPPANPALKDPNAFRLIGTPHKRLDTADKVNGNLKYGIDVMLPGMLFATLASSPTFGGTVASVDIAKARAVKGVREVVVLPDLVGVIGDHMWAAKTGLEALSVKWDAGANHAVSQASIQAGLDHANATENGVVAKQRGDAMARLQGDGVIEATFGFPFLAHAGMEPMNCTVHVRPNTCELWLGTQVIGMAQDAAAKETGLRPDQVIINSFLIGGAFGRRLEIDGVTKAVRIAKHVNVPVKVVWSREEDIQQEYYRPVYRSTISARVEDGKVTAWRHRVVGPSIIARWLPEFFTQGIDVDAVDGAVENPYDIPNFRVEYIRHEPKAVPMSFWRGVGPNNTIFSTECLIDHLAHETKTDPVAFRRNMLAKTPRALRVLDLVAAKAGWGTAPPAETASASERVGRGVALQWSWTTYVATIADVMVDDGGNVKVTRIVCAVDCGTIVNPDGVIAQIQGGSIFGISAVLHGEITIEGGRVQQSNFHDYRVLRITEAPTIEVHLVESGEVPGGMGEPGTVVVQPAVVNAIYAATGTRLTQMPVDPKLLKRTA